MPGSCHCDVSGRERTKTQSLTEAIRSTLWEAVAAGKGATGCKPTFICRVLGWEGVCILSTGNV